MFCQNCGEKINDGAQFCPNCGARIYTNDENDIKDNTSDNREKLSNVSAEQDSKNDLQGYHYQTHGSAEISKNGKARNHVPIWGKSWFVILMLIVFFPVGLILMWKYKKFNKVVRAIVTVFWALILVVMFVPGDSQEDNHTVSETNTEPVLKESSEAEPESPTETETETEESIEQPTSAVQTEATLPYTYDDIQFVTLHVNQRLNYDDNEVMDAIKKYVNGYETTGSYWVAYDCSWNSVFGFYEVNYDGEEYVLYSSDPNYFSSSGEYELALVNTGEVLPVVDGRGFQKKCPILNILNEWEVERAYAFASTQGVFDGCYDQNGDIIDIDHCEGITEDDFLGLWNDTINGRISLKIVRFNSIIDIYDQEGNNVAIGLYDGGDLNIKCMEGSNPNIYRGYCYINGENQLIWFQDEEAAPIVLEKETQDNQHDKNVGDYDDELSYYILPYSDTMYYTREDLAGLNKDMLRLARNEIHARHGRLFQAEDLENYFNAQPWYYGRISASDFDESVLNEYERANLDLIKEVEAGS